MCFPDEPDMTAFNEAMETQKQMQDEALEEQKKATAMSKAAMKPAEDSEAARDAAEERMRKLLEGSGYTGKRELGAAPTGYRLLTGA